MPHSSRFWPKSVAFLCLTAIFACRRDTPPVLPSPAPVAEPPLPAPKPERRQMQVQPFPERLTLARRDLPHFSASIDLAYPPVTQRGIPLQKLDGRLFGCFTLDTTARWIPEMNPRCPPGADFYGQSTYPHGEFVFYPLYSGGAEHPPAIVSVWKVRGDSLDFYALWDKAFSPGEWSTYLQITSVTKLSAKKRRVKGLLSWQDDETKRNVAKSWEAVWTLPGKLELR